MIVVPVALIAVAIMMFVVILANSSSGSDAVL
jgi:hypothetical protein